MSAEDTALGVVRWDHDDATIEATRADGTARVRVYRLDRAVVVLGSGSDAVVELDLDRCRADRVPLLRRRGGGCSVVLDPGNVILCAALPVEGLGGIKSHFAWISAWLAHVLDGLGIRDVRQEGVSDLAIGGRKFAGSCMHRTRDLLTYSVTMLVDGDVGLIERYLRHPPREPAYREGREHRAFVRTLAEYPGGVAAAPFERSLAETATAESLRNFPLP